MKTDRERAEEMLYDEFSDNMLDLINTQPVAYNSKIMLKEWIIDAMLEFKGHTPSDEEIEAWAGGEINRINPDEYGYGDCLIEGAKALRDNKIPKI